MWPFERKRDVLRIGRLSVELWRREAAGLVLSYRAPLHGPDNLGRAVREVLSARAGARKGLDVILESAWLPVVLVETGPSVWARDTVESLLRHRLTRAYDDRSDPVSTWALELDHRPGDRYGLGYALSPKVRMSVVEACTASGWEVHTIQPALQWAKRQSSAREGWWIWLEQDRALVAFLEQGRVTALNPAADLPRDSVQVARLVRIEQLRAGIEAAPADLTLSGWEEPFTLSELTPTSGLVWQGVAAAKTHPMQTVPAGSAA